jgi:hypothetical protein
VSESYNRLSALKEIQEALRCPADWAKVFQVQGPAYFEPLEALWYEILRQNVRGDEAHYIGPDYVRFDLPDAPDSELRAIQINVREWRNICLQEFLAAIRRFTDLRYASRRDYGKHLPPSGPQRKPDWIERESKKRNVSLFYFDIPEEEMLTAFLHAIFWQFSGGEDLLGLAPEEQVLWNRLIENDNSRIAFRCTGLIGASSGAPTKIICFELDATTPIVHGYPITEGEAHQIQSGYPIMKINELEKWELL